MKTFPFVFLIIILAGVSALGQEARADGNACELNSLYLDGLRNELANSPGAKLVAKYYSGKGESNAVAEKRAAYIRKFLEKQKGFDPTRLEFVNSGRLAGGGNPKTEFYIVQAGSADGPPHLVTYSLPNRTPCLDCCGNPFPPRYIGPARKSGKKASGKLRKSGR